MARSRVRKRVWRKVAVALIVGVVAFGSLIFWKRYEIAVWYMEGNKKTQELVILEMLDTARPVIESEIKMTLPEKIVSFVAGQRSEQKRQTDALIDVRKFCESGFENHRFKFRVARKLGSLNGFNLHGFDFALDWIRGNTEEVLEAFNLNFLKREVGLVQINPSCSFFSELKLYVEARAK